MKKFFPRIFYLFILLTFALFSCKEEEDFDTRINFRLINLSDIPIDSIKIYSFNDSIIFDNILVGDTTEFKKIEDVSIDPKFVMYFDNIKFIQYWECPRYVVDPAGRQFRLLPSGSYIFGIIECDTISKKMSIGLIDFTNNLFIR